MCLRAEHRSWNEADLRRDRPLDAHERIDRGGWVRASVAAVRRARDDPPGLAPRHDVRLGPDESLGLPARYPRTIVRRPTGGAECVGERDVVVGPPTARHPG